MKKYLIFLLVVVLLCTCSTTSLAYSYPSNHIIIDSTTEASRSGSFNVTLYCPSNKYADYIGIVIGGNDIVEVFEVTVVTTDSNNNWLSSRVFYFAANDGFEYYPLYTNAYVQGAKHTFYITPTSTSVSWNYGIVLLGPTGQ